MFFVLRIHFLYDLSYLFALFGVRTCVSILWHTSLPKNATFAWKNSEKPWFWRFLVIFVFLTWRHLWRHCGVIQGMFVLFWYQWTREGHSYPIVPHTWCFVNRFPRSWGAESAPRLWDGSKKPGSFRVKPICVNCQTFNMTVWLLSGILKCKCCHFHYAIASLKLFNHVRIIRRLIVLIFLGVF